MRRGAGLAHQEPTGDFTKSLKAKTGAGARGFLSASSPASWGRAGGRGGFYSQKKAGGAAAVTATLRTVFLCPPAFAFGDLQIFGPFSSSCAKAQTVSGSCGIKKEQSWLICGNHPKKWVMS